MGWAKWTILLDDRLNMLKNHNLFLKMNFTSVAKPVFHHIESMEKKIDLNSMQILV